MEVIFIRHAEAEPARAGGDAARRLTPDGRKQAKTTAKAVKRMGVKIELVLSSPLARAAETAEIVAEVHDAKLEQLDLLAPLGDIGPAAKRLSALLEKLAHDKRQTVALVGHAPSIGEYVSYFIAGTVSDAISFSKAGAACVDLDGHSAEFRWFMRREQLEAIAASR